MRTSRLPDERSSTKAGTNTTLNENIKAASIERIVPRESLSVFATPISVPIETPLFSNGVIARNSQRLLIGLLFSDDNSHV